MNMKETNQSVAKRIGNERHNRKGLGVLPLHWFFTHDSTTMIHLLEAKQINT